MDKFNNRLRQILILAVILLIAVFIIRYFYVFIPGVLGSVTLYILSKKSYFFLIEKKKWRRQLTALLYIFVYLILICLPVYFAVVILVPKVVALFNNPVQLMVAAKTFAAKIQNATGIELINGDNLQTVQGSYAFNRHGQFCNEFASNVFRVVLYADSWTCDGEVYRGNDAIEK